MLRSCLGREEITKKEEVVFFCPKKACIPYKAKNKPKLSVNLTTDIFHCWICGFASGNLVPIFHLRRDLPEFQEYLDEVKARYGEKKEEERKYIEPFLPNEFKSLSTTHRSPYYRAAMEYLSDRGITFSDILRYKLGYCEEGDYRYRIVVPSFDEYGEINFFVGRSFYDGGIKYKHEEFDKNIIFNDYLVDWTQPVVLTEGPFDMIKAGENAIPLQGSSIRTDSRLFQKIVMSQVPVYFALDTDAFRKQLYIIDKFLAYGIESYYVDLEGNKDVGAMDSKDFQIVKSKAALVKSDLDILKLRINA